MGEAPQATPKENVMMQRHFELDVAKAFAIVFMVVVHVYEMMCDVDYYLEMPDSLLRNVIEFLGGPLAAPVFMVAMGIGMVMTRHDSPKEFVKRGVKLIITGYALNFFRGTILILGGTGSRCGSGLWHDGAGNLAGC